MGEDVTIMNEGWGAAGKGGGGRERGRQTKKERRGERAGRVYYTN